MTKIQEHTNPFLCSYLQELPALLLGREFLRLESFGFAVFGLLALGFLFLLRLFLRQGDKLAYLERGKMPCTNGG